MADGKIYIIVTDQLPGGSSGIPEDETQKRAAKETNALADYAKHRFFNLIQSQAKQAVNYTVSNIGNFEGDYVKQQRVSETLQMINFAVDIATSAYAGWKATGGHPAGAVIGVVIAVGSKAISFGQEMHTASVENARQNREIAQLRTRAGLNSTNNGSRGTEN